MQRALDLACLGQGRVSPNPMVGCVLVHDDQIIGEGWHQQYGGPHAEVNAIKNVISPDFLPQCTMYVNLEPCAHHGKTPPCTELVISSGIKKIVIANHDPNPIVAGRGINQLQESGVEVVEGIMESEGMFLNRRFFRIHKSNRPYFILKWAQTSDGFIARTNYDSKWISNRSSRQLVHKYRAQEDAIMVGRNTAHYDNPQLTVRHWKGKNPIRLVLDPNLALDSRLNLFDGSVLTLCYNYVKDELGSNFQMIKGPEKGFLEFIGEDLYRRNIQSVLVEGGRKLLTSLIDNDYWDEARIFTSPIEFGEGIKAPDMAATNDEVSNISGDLLKTYYNPHGQINTQR